MARRFIALDLPLECRERLASLRHEVRGARWMDAERIHLTLAFLGDVPDHLRDPLVEELGEIRSPAFLLHLEGVGCFPPRRSPTTIWVGCREHEALTALKRRVDRALLASGQKIERRRFRPHVTLARLKDCSRIGLEELLQLYSLFSMPDVAVTSFSLYSSQLRPDGAVYRIEETFSLLPAPNQV